MFPPLLAALAMAKEGEQKTILQVYVSSISAHEFLLGKIFAFMVVAFAECLLMLVLLFTYFRPELGGRPDALSWSPRSPTPSAWRRLESWSARRSPARPRRCKRWPWAVSCWSSCSPVSSIPIENIPVGLRWLSNLIWGRYYIEIVRDALLQGGGWPATWYKVLEIIVTGAIFYGLAWRTLRRMQVKA